MPYLKPNLINIYKTIVKELATSSTCNRAQVGAILINEGRIICSAYNGSISGYKTCNEDGHVIENGHCIRTVHAEQNMISFCAKNGISTLNNDVVLSHYPCLVCTKMLFQSGIRFIYFVNNYRNSENIFNKPARMIKI